LYKNRVLIDRESTRKLEIRKLSNERSTSPATIGALVRDFHPGSSNYGKLVNYGGISEA
jgi:hypothetical protein